MEGPQIVFVTGLGRSGTTLLQNMLAAHSQIHFPPETHFFKRYLLPRLLNRQAPGLKELAVDSYFHRLPQEKQDFILTHNPKNLEHWRALFLEIMRGKREPVLGDKDNEYVRYVPQLARLFPGALLVHLVRNPFNVLASRRKAEWGKHRSVAFHAAEYRYYISRLRAEGPRYFGSRYIEFSYESLLKNPEARLAPLLRQFGLHFEAEMLDFHHKAQELVADDERTWKDNLRKPLQEDDPYRWRESLKEQEVALVQKGLEDFFTQYHYEQVTEKPALDAWLRSRVIERAFQWKTCKESL